MLRRGLKHATNVVGARAVSHHARQPALLRPAAVAIHNNGDMIGDMLDSGFYHFIYP
jgi:hypothetical protein